jgi:hypothetical protein
MQHQEFDSEGREIEPYDNFCDFYGFYGMFIAGNMSNTIFKLRRTAKLLNC